MKLYFSPAACSLAPQIALCEAKLSYEPIQVSLKTKEFNGGSLMDINPKGYVPVLELDTGDVLTEVAVLLQWIADKKPENNLLPKFGTKERYQCLEWLNFIATELHKGTGPLWNKKIPEEVRTLFKENLNKKFDYVEQHMDNKDFLMGKTFTVADIYLFTILNWFSYLKIDMNHWKNLARFYQSVKRRPAIIEALGKEGLLDKQN